MFCLQVWHPSLFAASRHLSPAGAPRGSGATRALTCAVVGVFVMLCGCAPAGGEQGGAAIVPAAVPAGDHQETLTNAKAGAPPVTEAPRPLSDQELEEGWISLFDGRTLFGWKASSDAAWRVESETIVVDGGSPGLLCTTSQFSDYVLKVEYRCEANTNSGIFLHTPLQPQDPAKDCYELNIAPPDNPFPTCSLVKRVKAEGEFQGTDWQAFEVTVQGDHVGVKWNGKPALDYTDPAPLRRGHIGLQLNQGRVAFRNIQLKPLGTASLFNGRDLTGWKEYPDLPSKFRVTPEGWLHVENGRGQLESAGSYGDFVLQLECVSHAPQLNSGVFFRCIPGEQMNGYECQIHNGVKEGDRSQPMDCGTGGFFRRQDARLVVPNDLEWFHMTLVADRNHMAAWVNGYQVSDWTDDRPPHDNPRNGRRDAPGTLMLQGHDPTTNLSFRGLRLSEIAPRAQ